MKVTYDPAKREKTLKERKLDFERAKEIFQGRYFTFRDERKDYGERRYITVGKLDSRVVVMVWTPRQKEERRIISMRHVHDKEKEYYKLYVD